MLKTQDETKRMRLATVPEALAYIAEHYSKMSRTKLYGKLSDGSFRARKRDGETLLDLNSIDDWHKALPKWTPSDNSKG